MMDNKQDFVRKKKHYKDRISYSGGINSNI